MQKFLDTIDNLPLYLKIILAIPALDIVWVIYRLCRSLVKENMIGVVISIALIIIGLPWLWAVDIVFLLLKGNVWWID